jgi:hypothetical protein
MSNSEWGGGRKKRLYQLARGTTENCTLCSQYKLDNSPPGSSAGNRGHGLDVASQVPSPPAWWPGRNRPIFWCISLYPSPAEYFLKAQSSYISWKHTLAEHRSWPFGDTLKLQHYYVCYPPLLLGTVSYLLLPRGSSLANSFVISKVLAAQLDFDHIA